ncbi:MAG: chromate transporter [Planctomycetes bacterium]|nr:chromate transporter [Planctomycetota bacterium]
MSEDIKAQADLLFQQGLFLYKDNKKPDVLRKVAVLWQRAIQLYKQLGDQERVKEIKSYCARLTIRVAPPKIVERLFINKSAPKKEFKDWNIFFKIGLFGVGGPLAVLSLLQEELVNRKKIMTNKDFLEGAVLGDILPGPVTMDIVTYTGFKLRGWLGAFYSTAIFILPSFLLMIAVAMLYTKYTSLPLVTNVFECLGAAVTAIIISVGLQMGKDEIKDYYGLGILLWAFISSMVFKFDILVVVGLSGVAGMLLTVLPPPSKCWAQEKKREIKNKDQV